MNNIFKKTAGCNDRWFFFYSEVMVLLCGTKGQGEGGKHPEAGPDVLPGCKSDHGELLAARCCTPRTVRGFGAADRKPPK
ncbi:MAG: hypothetical protein JW735_14095 [Prolixibacteraceae bacterium]|nr:hypothetical protein [Prolixibacteraceae bacterium]